MDDGVRRLRPVEASLRKEARPRWTGRLTATFVAAAWVLSMSACAILPTRGMTEKTVQIPARDVRLTGVLFVPDPPSPAGHRRPAIVLMHGCSGMYDNRGQISPPRREWAEQFVRWGFVALHVDSFRPRGIRTVCDLKARPPESDPWNSRVGDAYAALDFLAGREDVDPRQIFVLGWSHGGSTVTGVVRPEASGRRDDGRRFKAAIAFYPGCGRPLRTRNYRSTMPLLILHGLDDDWVPAEPCIELGRRFADGPFPIRTVTYTGARHGFDSINTPVRLVPNVYNPNAASERGAWVGGHEPSRVAALEEVRRFLDRQRSN